MRVWGRGILAYKGLEANETNCNCKRTKTVHILCVLLFAYKLKWLSYPMAQDVLRAHVLCFMPAPVFFCWFESIQTMHFFVQWSAFGGFEQV